MKKIDSNSLLIGLVTGILLTASAMTFHNQVGTYEAVIGEHIKAMVMINTKTGVFSGLDKKQERLLMWDLVNGKYQDIEIKISEAKKQ
jgi:hypothetical protein